MTPPDELDTSSLLMLETYEPTPAEILDKATDMLALLLEDGDFTIEKIWPLIEEKRKAYRDWSREELN